jgi:hypothetical protein
MTTTPGLPKGGYEKYRRWLLAAVATHLPLPKVGPEAQDVGQALTNLAFDLPGPRSINGPVPESTKHLGLLFHGYHEIYQSASALDDLIVYLARFPFGQTSVTRSRYLQFVIEGYFHENYILRERLCSHTKQIERAWRYDAKHSVVKTACGELREQVENRFKVLTERRGAFVHKQRFKDTGLAALSTLEMFLSVDAKAWEGQYMDRFRSVRKQWLSTMRTHRNGLAPMLDGYFDLLCKIGFSDSGALLFPCAGGASDGGVRGRR